MNQIIRYQKTCGSEVTTKDLAALREELLCKIPGSDGLVGILNGTTVLVAEPECPMHRSAIKEVLSYCGYVRN
jgi:hypothetical protein